jgi:hypothetical protein
MAGKGIDTMTIIKSICSGVGALSAVLLCASVLWSEMGDLDDGKLDKEVFVEYKKDTRQYLVENNERVKERFDSLDSKVDDGFEALKQLIEMEHKP